MQNLQVNNKWCKKCPYSGAAHMNNQGKPLRLENNNSKILLVFQAPGIEEWKQRKPIISKKRNSASSRMENAFKRKCKNRQDYDITEAVQCYPGYGNNRDKKPSKKAVECCKEHLKRDIINGKYEKIIAFGRIAQESVSEIVKGVASIEIVNKRHPCGGVTNNELDKEL